MWIPWRKKHLKPTWGNLIFSIIIPGIFIFYFVITEHSFVQNFKDEFEIMMFGEYFFLITHMAFVYYILPVTWFFELFIFMRVAIPDVEIQRTFFGFLSNSMYVFIVVMALMKLLAAVF